MSDFPPPDTSEIGTHFFVFDVNYVPSLCLFNNEAREPKPPPPYRQFNNCRFKRQIEICYKHALLSRGTESTTQKQRRKWSESLIVQYVIAIAQLSTAIMETRPRARNLLYFVSILII